jgi:DNA-binding CsgD family transcriptional regulator
MNIVQLPLLASTVKPEKISEYVNQIADRDQRTLAQCDYCYYQGNVKKATFLATELYKNKNPIYSVFGEVYLLFTSLLMGNMKISLEGTLHRLKQIIDELCKENASEEQIESLRFLYFISPAFSQQEFDQIEPNPRKLSPGLRLMYFYVQAFQKCLKNDYSTSIAIASTALNACSEHYALSEIYLNLVLATNYVGMKEIPQAKQYFEKAWEIAQPAGLILPFTELHNPLHGFYDDVIRRDSIETYDLIYKYVSSFSRGWMHLSNSNREGECITQELTAMEFSVAVLVKNGWKNQDIAEYFGLSLASIKLYLSNVFWKLGITKRKELFDFKLK